MELKMKVSNSSFILFILIFSPFLTIPKIYVGVDLFPLFFDFLFFCFFLLLIVNKKYKGPKDIYLLWWIGFAFNLFYLFYNDIPSLYGKISSFRLSAFYFIAFIIPFFCIWDEIKIAKLSKNISIVGIIISLDAIRQWFFPLASEINFANQAGGAVKFYGDSFQGGSNTFRVFGTFITSVHLSFFLTLVIYISLVNIFFSKNKSKFYIISLVVCSLAFILTFSRSSWLSSIFGLAPFILFVLIKTKGKKRLGIIFFCLISFILTMIAYYSIPLVQARINTLFQINDVSSFQSRLLLWAARWKDITSNPYGYGVGAAGWNVNKEMSLGADSNYLKFLLELGFFGGVFFFYLLFSIFFKFFNWFRKIFLSKGKRVFDILECFPIVSFCFYIATLISMITNQVLEAYPSNLFFWFFTGLGLKLIFLNNEGYNKWKKI